MCCDFKYRSSDSAHGIFFTGGDGRWLLTGAYNLVQNSGKRTLFPQNWSDNDAKMYRLKSFTIFLICMCERQDDQNGYSRSHEMRF